MASKVKGRLTFRIAAVLFIVSAVFELITVTSGAPLFGAMRGGLVAIVYHLIYVGLYLYLGIGLWQAKPWGYKLVFLTTFIYTLDKAQYLLYRESMLAGLMGQLGGSKELWEMVDKQMVLQAITIVTLLIVAGWWGFAIYTYYRRDFFLSQQENLNTQTVPEENNDGT